MWAGRVVLGRYAIRAPLPGTPDQARWEADDTAGGGTVEIFAPSGVAALRPGASETFSRATRDLPTHPAVLHPLATGLEGAQPLAVRAPGNTLWSAQQRLLPAEALALAAWLGPAVAASAAQLGEGLRQEDLVIDSEGIVRLAPAGLRTSDGILPPPRHRAPERKAGEPGDPAAALYGLGVLLFRAVTGQDAVPGATTPAWAEAQRTPLAPRALVPDLPVALDALLTGLLSNDPSVRIATLTALPEGAPVRVAHPSAPLTVTEPAPPVRRPLSAHADLGLAPWVVSVRPAALGTAARRRAAALTGVSGAALAGLARGQRPAPILEAQTRGDAERAAHALRVSGVPFRISRGDAPWGLGMLALLCFALAAFVGLLGALTVPLVGVPLALLLGVAALGAGGSAALRSAEIASLRAGKRALLSTEDGPSTPVETRLRTLRKALLEGDLPEPIRVDLMAALDDAEDRLDALPAIESAANVEARSAILADAEAIAAATAPTPSPSASTTHARLRAVRATLAAPET